MSRRIDWYDDPAAPPVNSVKPSAATWVLNQDRVLLIRRNDNGNWSMPGGAMDPGESLVRCAVRETLEETGVEVAITGVGGIWTDPLHRIEYTSDGEVRQEFTVVYRAERRAGEVRTSEESTAVEWVPLDRLQDLQMDRSQRMRVQHLSSTTGTYHDPR